MVIYIYPLIFISILYFGGSWRKVFIKCFVRGVNFFTKSYFDLQIFSQNIINSYMLEGWDSLGARSLEYGLIVNKLGKSLDVE